MSEPPAPGAVAVRPPHPFLYLLLFLPFGASSGFILVTIGSLAGTAGLSDEVIAGMVVMNVTPNTFKVLWAPLVDTIWTPRGWYISSNLVSSITVIALGFIPISSATVPLLTGIIFLNGLSTSFIAMCVESMMARLTPPEQRGAAGGWSQAGNLGGSTIGGLGLLIAEHSIYPWMAAVVVGGMLLSCSLVLGFIKEPPPPEPRPRFFANLRALGTDIWGLLVDQRRADKVRPKWLLWLPPVFLWALSGAGILAITLSVMPIGSGGAQNVFSAIAPDWDASPELVSIANGLVSGGASILGCLAGGWLSTLLDKRKAYALSGVILAVVTFGMALAPRIPAMYAAGVIAYSFGLGLCYSTFTVFVLDIIGHTGGATKYNLFASLANIPILTMGFVDGYVATAYGRTTMLWVDGLAGVAGAIVLLGVVWILRLRRLDPTPAP